MISYDHFVNRYNKILDALVFFQFSTLWDQIFVFDAKNTNVKTYHTCKSAGTGYISQQAMGSHPSPNATPVFCIPMSDKWWYTFDDKLTFYPFPLTISRNEKDDYDLFWSDYISCKNFTLNPRTAKEIVDPGKLFRV